MKCAGCLWPPAIWLCLLAGPATAQKAPDVSCRLEDYPINTLVSWQFPETLAKVQAVVLRDPDGEQEARFDLTHGATLVSLRYRGKELLYGRGAGAGVAMFQSPSQLAAEIRARRPFFLGFNPSQGDSSMGVPATVAGVACQGERSMRAFAMMIDRAANNSFQSKPLLGVWMGHVSSNFPVGYSTPYTIETNAAWVENPGGAPRWYLRLEQTIVNIRPSPSGPMEWYLEGASPWEFEHAAAHPEKCNEKTPCTSTSAPVLAAGRYVDAARTVGFATVVPTPVWQTSRAYVRGNAEMIPLRDLLRHMFAEVLTKPLEGLDHFRFNWYVCAGSWEQARAFAERAAR